MLLSGCPHDQKEDPSIARLKAEDDFICSAQNLQEDACDREPAVSIQRGAVKMFCCDCDTSERPIIEESARLQDEAVLCIANFLDLDPKERESIVKYKMFRRPGPVPADYGQDSQDCHKEHSDTVRASGFIGLIRKGQAAVSSVEDVRMELHETAHAITYGADHEGFVISFAAPWFDEGFSIWLESNLNCHNAKQWPLSRRMEEAHADWIRLKNGVSLKEMGAAEPHRQGAIFFAALEQDYGCTPECVAAIWRELRQDIKNWKPDEKSLSQLIREVSTHVILDKTGRYADLSSVFKTLELRDTY